jgi:hypothetical protein
MRATQIINVCQSMFIIIDHIQEYSTNLTHISKLEVSRNDTITIQCGIHCHTPIQNFYKTGIWLTSQVLVFHQHQSVVNVSVPLLGPPPPAARERTRVHPKTLALQLFPSAMTTNPSQHQNGVIWMIGKWYSNLNRTTTDCLKKKARPNSTQIAASPLGAVAQIATFGNVLVLVVKNPKRRSLGGVPMDPPATWVVYYTTHIFGCVRWYYPAVS